MKLVLTCESDWRAHWLLPSNYFSLNKTVPISARAPCCYNLIMKLILFVLVVLLGACSNSVSGPRAKFEDLSRSQQQQVKERYQILLKANEERDFSKVMEHAEAISSLLKDYNDTRAYAVIAERHLKEAQKR